MLLFSHLSQHDRYLLLRNLVAAPILEEVLFRGVLIASLSAASPDSSGRSNHLWLCLHAPLYFGAAHLHHLLERVRAGARLSSALGGVLAQFAYTYVFGVLASQLLLRTSSLCAAVAAHFICNFMSLPDLSFLDADHALFRHRHALLALHAAGLVLFAALLGPCTLVFRPHSAY